MGLRPLVLCLPAFLWWRTGAYPREQKLWLQMTVVITTLCQGWFNEINLCHFFWFFHFHVLWSYWSFPYLKLFFLIIGFLKVTSVSIPSTTTICEWLPLSYLCLIFYGSTTWLPIEMSLRRWFFSFFFFFLSSILWLLLPPHLQSNMYFH